MFSNNTVSQIFDWQFIFIWTKRKKNRSKNISISFPNSCVPSPAIFKLKRPTQYCYRCPSIAIEPHHSPGHNKNNSIQRKFQFWYRSNENKIKLKLFSLENKYNLLLYCQKNENMELMPKNWFLRNSNKRLHCFPAQLWATSFTVYSFIIGRDNCWIQFKTK